MKNVNLEEMTGILGCGMIPKLNTFPSPYFENTAFL
jgi:hypothetical protein